MEKQLFHPIFRNLLEKSEKYQELYNKRFSSMIQSFETEIMLNELEDFKNKMNTFIKENYPSFIGNLVVQNHCKLTFNEKVLFDGNTGITGENYENWLKNITNIESFIKEYVAKINDKYVEFSKIIKEKIYPHLENIFNRNILFKKYGLNYEIVMTMDGTLLWRIPTAFETYSYRKNGKKYFEVIKTTEINEHDMMEQSISQMNKFLKSIEYHFDPFELCRLFTKNNLPFQIRGTKLSVVSFEEN